MRIKAIGILHAVQKLSDALGMSDWAVFVTHKKSSEVADFIV